MKHVGRIDTEKVTEWRMPRLGLPKHLFGDNGNFLGEIFEVTNVVGLDPMPIVKIAVKGNSRVDVVELALEILENDPPPFSGRHGFPLFVPIALELSHSVANCKKFSGVGQGLHAALSPTRVASSPSTSQS